MLRIRGRAPFVVATLVGAAATIVVLFQVLSRFDALTRPGILVGQSALAGIAVGAWWATGRRRPPRLGRLHVGTVIAAARAHPTVAILSGAAMSALVVQFVVAVTVAPNNWDSMTYHLSRAAYWLQHDSAMQWTGGSIRQLHAPPNAEMLVAWTMSMRGTDQLASLVQWTALVGLGVAIFSICRLIGVPIAASMFAAECFVVLPQPIMQATTTQNDLVASFFIVAAMLFGIRGLRDRSIGDLAVAAASLGLAVGTKGTTLIAMPSLALVIGYASWRYQPPRRIALTACGLGLCGVVAFGAFNYVQNFGNTGNPFGSIPTIMRTSPVRHNLGRVMWAFADSPGTAAPWLELVLKRPFQKLFGELTHPRFELAIDMTIQEDYAAFGLAGLLAFVPILLVTAIRPRSAPWPRIVALAALGYILAFAITREWNPWVGRVLMPGVAIGAPLFASYASSRWLSGVVLALALAGLVPSVVSNVQKPLLVSREDNVFRLDRIRQQTLIRGEMLPVISAVNARLGPADALGFVGSEDSWDYPLFGERRERRVLRLEAAHVNVGLMVSQGLAGVLFANVAPPPPPLVSHKIGDGYYLAVTRDQFALAP
jgi:hypothetical protein